MGLSPSLPIVLDNDRHLSNLVVERGHLKKWLAPQLAKQDPVLRANEQLIDIPLNKRLLEDSQRGDDYHSIFTQ